MKYKKTTAVGAALTLALVLAVTVGFASGPKEDSAASTVEYHGRAYNRADLSAETLEWLDWYLALPEEGRLAVSYEPWELHSEEFPGTVDAGADQPAAAEEELPAFEPDYDPQAEDSFPDAPANALAVCPVEGCAVRGSHTHDGVAYLCSGAHCGGVCDGSCHNAGDGGGAVPSESKIPGFVPDYDPSTQDSAGAGGEPVSQPASSGHHSDSHHGNGYQGGRH